MSNSEHEHQARLVNYLETNHPDILFFAIPNGAPLSGGGRASRRLKAEGMLPGAADVFLACPRGKWHGMFLEMKSDFGKLSENQEWFLQQAESNGYFTAVAFGYSQARELVEEYLSWI